jgi:hypothetical protein
MATTSDHQLAVQVARELSSPEPAVHFGLTLVVATLVASPVLASAAIGQQTVPMALALYLAAIVAAWLLVGVVGGALAMFGRAEMLAEQRVPDPAEERRDAPSTAAVEASPPGSTESVGSNGAH